MEQLFVNLEKDRYPTKDAVRVVLSSRHPDYDVQAILDGGDRWVSRLVAADEDMSKLEESTDGDLPPLPGDEEDAPEGDDDKPKGEKEDKKDDGEEKKEDKPKKKPKEDSDLAGRVQDIIGELTDLLDELGGAASDLQGKHDEKDQKLKDISDLTSDVSEGPGGMPESLEDIGPVPGGPDLGMSEGVTPPKPPTKADKRRKPMVGVPAFTNSRMVSVPLFKGNGEKTSLAAAANRIYSDERYNEYEISGIVSDEDENRYVAHLTLKDS